MGGKSTPKLAVVRIVFGVFSGSTWGDMMIPVIEAIGAECV